MNNKIKDSWEKIMPSNATHERVLDNILHQAHEIDINKEGKRFMTLSTLWKVAAPVTACLIVAMLVAVPLLVNEGIFDERFGRVHTENGYEEDFGGQNNGQDTGPTDTNGSQNQASGQDYTGNQDHATSQADTNNGNGNGLALPSPALPDTTAELTINEVSYYAWIHNPGLYDSTPDDDTGLQVSGTPARIVPWLYFWHPISYDELQQMLPGLDLSVYGTAMYLYDGTLIGVTLSEDEPYDPIVLTGGDEHFTKICISPTKIDSGFFFVGYEPVTSYVYGVPVLAGITSSPDRDIVVFLAIFEMDGIYYSIQLTDYKDGDQGQIRLIQIVTALISVGPANLDILLDPVIPALGFEDLTKEEALADPLFGAFVPRELPPGIFMDSAIRIRTQHDNMLSISLSEAWATSIRWNIVQAHEQILQFLVSPDEPEKFDVRLYTIPWMDSVPQEAINYLQSPIFRAEDMSLELVEARVMPESRRGGWSMTFEILIDDVVIQIGSSGHLSPEALWGMIQQVIGYR